MTDSHGIHDPDDRASAASVSRSTSGPRPSSSWSRLTWPAGWTVHHVRETGSTNADLLAAAEAGTACDRTVLATDHQTAGRGRLDRRWDAPAGTNLLVSLLFMTDSQRPARLTQMVGLAAVRGLEALVGRRMPARLGLKWPNDVLLDGRKLAGVLAQRSVTAHAVVVGIGLNVGWAPDDAANVRRDLDAGIAPADVLAAMLGEIDTLLAPGVDLGADYRDRLLTIGHRVRIHLPGERELIGEARDVDADGRLLVVDDDGGRHRLDAGDVVHLRPA